MSTTRRRSNLPPLPEKIEPCFSEETLGRLAQARIAEIERVVVYRRRVPSRETVEADPQTVHVSLDAGGVVGRIHVDNAISPKEHEALLGWYDRGFDKGFAREYAGDATSNFSGNLSQRLTVDRWDLTRPGTAYKTEGGQRDATSYVMEFDGVNTKIAETVLRIYSARVREVMDLIRAGDARVRFAGPDEGEAAEPTGEACKEARANDTASGGDDDVRARADDLAADLDENFGDPEAIQLTTYQPRPQSGMAQHFDSRARFLSIATMSLRACVKLVQIRGPKDRKKGGQERSEIRLLPRSIYVMSGPARANCHIKDIAAVQATKNHGDCPCCWTHGIDTDQAEAQGRIGVTFRQLAPWALHEAEQKQLFDARAAADKAAHEAPFDVARRRQSTPKRRPPRAPAAALTTADRARSWLSADGADAVRAWRSTLTPDAWDALAGANGLTRNNVPARGWHREVKGTVLAYTPPPPAPKLHVASTASAWVAVCTDLLELASKQTSVIGLHGALASRGFRCGELKSERTYYDISVPPDFPCYYDIVGKDVKSNRDVARSLPQLVGYLQGALALAETGSAYRTETEQESDGGENARRANKADVSFHYPGQFDVKEVLRSRSDVERHLATNATPRFEAPRLDAFSFENGVAGAFPSLPRSYYTRLSAKVVEQLRPAAPQALTAAVAESDLESEPVVESDSEDDFDWGDQDPAKKPRGAPKGRAPASAPKGREDVNFGSTFYKSLGGAEAVRAWRSTLTPDAWDALAGADGLTRNNVPARGWHRELKMRKASVNKCDIFFHPPGQLVGTEHLRSMPDVSRYLAANATPLFEAPQLDDFSLARDGNPALFPSAPEGYYKRLRSRVAELLRPAAAPALPPSASARPPAAPALILAAPALPPPQPQNVRPRPDLAAKPRAAPVPASKKLHAAPKPEAAPHHSSKGCEVRRVGGSWRRFASQSDAVRKIPALTQPEINGLVNESRDGRLRSNADPVRGTYEARDYVGDNFEAEDAPAAPTPAPTPASAPAPAAKKPRMASRPEAAPAPATATSSPLAEARKTSRFAGVTWVADGEGQWKAEIKIQKNVIRLGYFDVEEEAARAYDAARAKWQALFRQNNKRPLNFPDEAPLEATLAALPPLPSLLQPPAPLAPRRRSAPGAPDERIGQWVEVYLAGDSAWYLGHVHSARYSDAKGDFVFRVDYTDGDTFHQVLQQDPFAGAGTPPPQPDGAPERWRFPTGPTPLSPAERAWRWTPREEHDLRRLVDELGDSAWDAVAERLGTRNACGAERHWGVLTGVRTASGKQGDKPRKPCAPRPAAPAPRPRPPRAARGALATTVPPPLGSRVAVRFDDGEEYEGTVGDALDEKRATVNYDDGQSEPVLFPDPDVRVTRVGPGAPPAPAASREARRTRRRGADEDMQLTEALQRSLEDAPEAPPLDAVVPAKKRRGPPQKVRAPAPQTARVEVGNWRVVGAQAANADDPSIRGVLVSRPSARYWDVQTKDSVMRILYAQLTQTKLTDEEAASCSRALSSTEYLQARIDGAICVRYDGGREFKNCYTSADGTERRQFEVIATHVRCALCPETRTWSLESSRLMSELRDHCRHDKGGIAQVHRERLAAAATAPSSSALPPPTLSPPTASARRGVDGEVMPAKRARGPPKTRVSSPPLAAPLVPPPALAESTSPVSLLQARIDKEICVRDDDGVCTRNCFTSNDGTEMRQFIVSATGSVRCAICSDTPFVRSSRTPEVTLLHDLMKHSGQYESQRSVPQTQAHQQRLRMLAGAPPPRAEASNAPLPPPPQNAAQTAAAPVLQRASVSAGNWCVVGAHVEDVNDATVRGIVTDIRRRGGNGGNREVTTTTGSVVTFKTCQLTQTALTDAEAARCVRPSSTKDYVQARIDGAIRFSHDGRDFKNRYTCADGTERRQFEVSDDRVRCALCPDARMTWSVETDIASLVASLKQHCGQTGNVRGDILGVARHLDRLALSAAAPPITEASTTPAPAPVVSPAPAPAEPPRVPLDSPLPLPPASSLLTLLTERICVGTIVEASPHLWGRGFVTRVGPKVRYRGIVVEHDSRNRLPVGCSPPVLGEHVWCVRYDDDGEVWASPDRFLSIVESPQLAPVDGQRAGRARTKPQRLTDLVDAGRSYAPAPDDTGSQASPVAQLPSPPLRAPTPAPRASGGGRVCVGAVVEAKADAWGADYARTVPATKRYRGTVVELGADIDLPDGCPRPLAGKRVWRVHYDDYDTVWATPERFLSVVAAPASPAAPAAPAVFFLPTRSETDDRAASSPPPLVAATIAPPPAGESASCDRIAPRARRRAESASDHNAAPATKKPRGPVRDRASPSPTDSGESPRIAMPPPPPVLLPQSRRAYATPDWCVVGAQVACSDDPSVRGIIVERTYQSVYWEIRTTKDTLVSVRKAQLTQTKLTDEEAASCSRALSSTELLQARIDGAICVRYAGREFKNCYTSTGGTERRKFEVTTAGDVRCALCCGDDAPVSLSSRTPWKTLSQALKGHAGHFPSSQAENTTQTHLKSLFASAGAPVPASLPAIASAKRPRAPLSHAPQPRGTPRDLVPAVPAGWSYSTPSDDEAGPAKRPRADNSHRTRSSTPQNVPRAAPPLIVFSVASEAPFVRATRWPEMGEECEFRADDVWYSGRCIEATEARVLLSYAERKIKGQAHELYKADDAPADYIRLLADAPELPANIV